MSIAAALITLIPEAVRLTMDIATAVAKSRGIQLDTEEWNLLGPEIQDLVTLAVSGDDITHDKLMEILPNTLAMRVLQLQKRSERLAAGLPTTGI